MEVPVPAESQGDITKVLKDASSCIQPQCREPTLQASMMLIILGPALPLYPPCSVSSPSDHGFLDLETPSPVEESQNLSYDTEQPLKATNKRSVSSETIRPLSRSYSQSKFSTRTLCTAPDEDKISEVRIGTGTKPIKLEDEKQVREYLLLLLEQLKQLGVKKVLTEWIAKICPRKQSDCPYIKSDPKWIKKHGAENEEPPRPIWWPIDKCKHKEPAHISKDGSFNVESLDFFTKH